MGTPTFTFGNPLAYGGDNISDTFSITLPKTFTAAPVGPAATGRVEISLCPTRLYTAAACASTTGLPVVASVNLTSSGTAVTGTVTFPEVAHIRYSYIPDATGRYNPISTVRSDGVAFTQTTVRFDVTGATANPWTTPFLPQQTLTFRTTTVTSGNRYSWAIFAQPNCAGTPVASSSKSTTTTIAYTNFSVANTYSGRVIITNSSSGARFGESGCQALTVERGTAEIVFTDPITYTSNGASDAFTLKVDRDDSTPVGPLPTGRVDISLCPVATYTAETCLTATGLAVATSVTVATAGASVSGNVTFSQNAYVRSTFVPDSANRYATVARVTTDGVYVTTTLSYTVGGFGTYPWTRPLLPSQSVTFAVSAVSGQSQVEWAFYASATCTGPTTSTYAGAYIGNAPGTYSGRAITRDSSGVRIGDSGCQTLLVRRGTAGIVFDDPLAYNGKGVSDSYAFRVVRTSNEIGPLPAGQAQVFLCPTRSYTTATCASVTTGAVAFHDVANAAPATGSVAMTEPSYVKTSFTQSYEGRYNVPATLVTAEFTVDPTPTITIGVTPGAITLGALSPDCGTVPAGASCIRTSDGALYTYSGAIIVTVTASDEWTGGCGRQPQTELSETPDRLMIRTAGSGGWQNLPIVDGAVAVPTGCFGSFPPGTTTRFTFDLAVNVRWSDEPDLLGDVIVFEVTTA